MRVEEIIKNYLKRKGWDIVYKVDISRKKEKYLIYAQISRDDWKISIRVDEGYEDRAKDIGKKYGVDKLPELMATSSAYHEYGHWDKCPFDIDYFEEILDGVSKGLKEVGIDKDKIEVRALDIANAFMDFLVNSMYAFEDEEFKMGIGSLYLTVGVISKKFSDGYALFVDVQSKLYQDKKLFRKLSQKFGRYRKIREDSKRLLSVLLTPYLAKKAFSNNLNEEDKKLILELLEDRSKWREKAREFAKIMAKYDIREDESKLLDSPFTRKMREGSGFRREVIRRGLEKGHKLEWVNEFEIFDETYEMVSEEIILKFLKEKEHSPLFPIFWMKKERIEGEDKLENIAWERTIFVERGKEEEVWLYRKRVPYAIEIGPEIKLESFEDILFIYDVSGSMGWSGKPLDGSKYDLAIRSVYGVIKYLERIGKAFHLNYGILLFSDTTSWSGWKGYWEIEEIKRALFKGYQGGNTGLEKKKVEEALETSKDNFLALMLSDGEFNINPSEALRACEKIIERGNDFVLLQFQSNDEFSSRLKEMGAIVKHIDRAEDLIGLVLERVKEKYGIKI